jgi:hypothetical protein
LEEKKKVSLSEKDLNTLVEEKLGIRRNKTIKNMQNVKLMAWEQVLLAAIYARSQYFGKIEHRNQYKSRLLLLKLARPWPEIYQEVVHLLDKGMGYFSIIDKLRESTTDNPLTPEQKFITQCEHESLGFPETPEPPLYSYGVLDHAVNNIVSILQRLLQTPSPSELFDVVANSKIKEKYIPRFFGDNRDLSTLDKVLKYVEYDHDLGNEILHAIDECMSTWMKKVFNLFFDPRSSQEKDSNGKSTQKQKLCTASQNIKENTVTLTFNRRRLEQSMVLGQHDQVMLSIQNELRAFTSEMLIKAGKETSPHAHTTLSQWHQKCSVLSLRQDKSIPSIVAALLEWDVKLSFMNLGSLHRILEDVKESKPSSRETEMLTTKIIHHCLFKNGKIHDFEKKDWFQLYREIKNIEPEECTNLEHLSDPLMRVWSDFDTRKMKERFQSPRKNLDDRLRKIEKLVIEQRKRSMSCDYPVGGPFPLPLWNKNPD